MKIAIDCGCLSSNEEKLNTGVYQLCLNLLKNLSSIDKKNNYVLYSFSPIPSSIINSLNSNFCNSVLVPRRYWLSLRISLEFLLNKPDVFLAVGQALPPYHPSQNISIIYDLAFERFPKCYLTSQKRLSRQTKFCVRHSDKIISISKSTKNDLIDFCHLEEQKIRIIYPGFEDIFKPRLYKDVVSIRSKYKINGPYFLFVGSLKPIKNVPKLIDAFCELKKKMKTKHKLVIVGSDFWLDPIIYKKIKMHKLEKEVINLGYIEREDLPKLYTGAIAFVSPSLFEGFGLPHLEAMACGCPVIVGNAGSQPEVVGKAGILIDPSSSKEISDYMYKVAVDSNFRSKISNLSIVQARKFSWSNFAQGVLEEINRFDPKYNH